MPLPRIILLTVLFASCNRAFHLPLPERKSDAPGGTRVYQTTGGMKWDEREPIIMREILAGNVPAFLKKFVRIDVSVTDSATNKRIKVYYFVAPDYLSLGSDDDWARIPLTPMTAQKIADSLQCFLPTRKMVNDIYSQSRVKPAPVPLYSHRDSALIFWHHHLIIEGQRKGRKGLISGIKKDVVISPQLSRDPRGNRVAIFGWHREDGKPIQPLYTGHVNWYVDYSHGIRLVYRMINVNRKWMDYSKVMADPVLRRALTDEEGIFLRY